MKHMFGVYGHNHITSIYLIEYDSVDVERGRPSNPATSRKRDTANASCYHSYISTTLDLSKDYLFQATERGHYKKNQCWLNTLVDIYGNGLLSQNKQQRYIITVDKIVETICMTDCHVEWGFAVHEFEPFFQEIQNACEGV